MTQPRHQPTSSNLTESQNDLLAVAESRAAEAEEAVDKLREKLTGVPAMQTPRSCDSAEVFEISEKVARRMRPEGWVHCEKEGPAARLTARMDKMEKVQEKHQDFINQYLGEQKFRRFMAPLMIGLLGSSVAAGVFALIFRSLIASARAMP